MEKEISGRSKGTSEYGKLAIVLIVLVVIIGGFSLYLAWPLLTGTTVILDTRPIDPFDPFRGQYFVINYEIGTIPIVDGASEGNRVYVSITEDSEGIWRYNGASLTKPDTGIFLRGNVERFSRGEMNVNYGIEQFFFERNADVPTRGIEVEVKVSGSGGARIVNLLQDGEPIEIEYESVSLRS